MTKPLRRTSEALDTAGMTREDGGLLGEAFLPSARPITWPRVWLDGDRLYYGYDPERPKLRPIEGDSVGMLNRFWRIARPQQVVDFADRYGVLGICEHGLPAPHNHARPRAPGDSQVGECRPQRVGTRERVYFEPIDRWLHYARVARGLLDVAAALHYGDPGARQDWAAIFADDGADTDPDERAILLSEPRAVQKGRIMLALLVNEWLDMGQVGMSFVWPFRSGAPELPTLAAGTFGLLGMQLALAIARADFRRCSSCGMRYPRTGRQPTRTRRNFCNDCKDKAANNLRQRELRALDQKILQLADVGTLRRDIARTLRITAARVADAIRRRDGRRKHPSKTGNR